MRNQIMKSMKRNVELNMMYLARDGGVSKRRIKVLWVGERSFTAFCYLQQSKRTFIIENVLALVPITMNERDVV